MNEIKAYMIASFCLTLSKIDIPDVNCAEEEQIENPITSTMDKKEKLSLIHSF